MLSLLMLGVTGALAQDVLINEVYYDAPTGEDEGASEWIELCNPGTSTVDLSGWQVENAGSSWSEVWTFPEGTTLAPGAYLAFGPGAGDKDEFSPNLQNGGSETDGLRLLDGVAAVVDTVLYDSNNSNGLLDDKGSDAGPFAPDVSAGTSLARFPDCTETNNDGSDFVQADVLTMGTANPAPPDCSLDSGADVLINEFMANPAGADGDAEWIELYNPGTVDADLSGWLLLGGTSAGGSLGALPEGTILPAGGYLIVGGDLVEKALGEAPDVVLGFSLGNASSNADGIMIADCNEVIYDTVVYGPELSKGDGWLDDTGATPTLAPTPGDGESIGRIPNGADTDDIGADFEARPFPTPWEANDVIATCPGQDDVKINEFLPNPDSEETSTDDLREWVELINTGSEAVDLEGWVIQWGTSSYSGSVSIPAGYSIPAGGLFVVGGQEVASADYKVPEEDDIAMGAAGSSPDGLRLLHCGPGLSDTVIYGPADGENSDEWTDDSGAVAASWAPKPEAGLSIARRNDGVDTDDSFDDFVVSATPSPGEPNPVVACTSFADGALIKINEIFPNPGGTDGGNEWLELYNAAGEDIALDGWAIQTGSSSWNTKFTFPPETVLVAGDYLVVADEEVPSEGADLYSSTNLSLGNASTGLDGVRLLDCPGLIADTLLYGKSGAEPDAEEEPWQDDAGGQTFALFPEDDSVSIARYPDGEDTDDNSVDFASGVSPSPGAANPEPGGGGGNNGGGGSTTSGCNNKESGSSADSGKCSAVPLAASPLWLMLVAGLLRRRQRRA